MKNKSKKFLIVMASAFVVIATTGIATSFAAEQVPHFSNRFANGFMHFKEGKDNLVNAIAQKFNLKTEDVQAVFDEHQNEMLANREEFFVQRINEQVANGALTQAQANALLAKRTEMIDFGKTLENKTPEEIQQAMKTQMESLKVWAEQNDITLKDLRGLHLGFGPMMVNHGKMMRGF